MRVTVIVPVYKPGAELFELLDRLSAQTKPVEKIILMNTEQRYFDDLVGTMDFAAKYPQVEVHHLTKEAFDHGATRNEGVSYSDTEVFVMMTQDAKPVDDMLIENLTKDLGGEIVSCYGRQLAGQFSGEFERISRKFNYPEESSVKSKEDLERLGIKTFFCSNVCAAYVREVYDKLGGFTNHTIFNEDMIYAAAVIKAGYKIKYAADACVIHAHNFTNMQQFRRNFDLGVSQADHPEIFETVKSESEGKKLVKAAWQELRAEKRLHKFPGFCIQCVYKLMGYKLGKRYKTLSRAQILKYTSNREYWKF